MKNVYAHHSMSRQHVRCSESSFKTYIYRKFICYRRVLVYAHIYIYIYLVYSGWDTVALETRGRRPRLPNTGSEAYLSGCSRWAVPLSPQLGE